MSGRRTVDGPRWIRRAAAMALILAAAGCGAPTDSGIPLAQKRSWETSFNRGDSAAVAALYAPDAELVMSGAAPVRGREAIRAEVDKMLQSGVKLRIGTDRAEAAGDLAYFYGSYSVSSNQGVVERGTYLEVWHRTRGHWLIELDVNATGAPVSPIPRR
ncbi:MAG TPA: nuclear transport factor 2 family protein [Steroidobacteraceae bacterium]|nr:nuclear transport factor 2 family protein [Steroidobacteraceae bacterium]